MEEKHIEFETAKLAKEKGIVFRDIFPFNYSCYLKNGELKNDDAFKDSEKIQSNIPTQSLLQKFLREEHGILVWVDPEYYDGWHFYCNITLPNGGFTKVVGDSWEQALEKGLLEALKLIEV